MDKRPTSVTVISVIMIVFGSLGLLGVLAIVDLQDDPMIQDALAQVDVPVPVHIAMSGVGMAVGIVSGVAFLLRQGWMRFVYMAWWLIGFIYGYMANPYWILSMPMSVAFFGIVMYFLFSPKARAWFGGKASAAPAA
ncbi:MAG TPA: hypothetical protein VKT74_07245 [Gammaproteobacteria bacterium]|nr:hypothetical protein [Gammaproteobacteria bacterium]